MYVSLVRWNHHQGAASPGSLPAQAFQRKAFKFSEERFITIHPCNVVDNVQNFISVITNEVNLFNIVD